MGENTPGTADIKYERDRFVAFAFATADAFVELDQSQRVVYATGAVQWLAAAPADKLVGTPFANLVSDVDRPLFVAALAAGQRQGRVGPLALSIRRLNGQSLRVSVSGTCLPVRGGRSYLSISAQRLPAAVTAKGTEVGGLLSQDAFADAAKAALQAGAAAGRNPNLTMLTLDGIGALKGRLDPKSAEAMMVEIAAHLQANSVNGAAAGRIGEDKFGLVHDTTLDIAGLKAAIADKAKEVDPAGKGLTVATATVDLDPGAMSDGDHAKALLYTINKFSESRGEFTVASLMDGYKEMLDDTRAKIATTKATITKGAFDVLFQPIVDLGTRAVHHYEALVRLRGQGKEASPFTFITFAEEVGLIPEFDLAMTQKVIAKIKGAKERGDSVGIAVNISGRSLESVPFMAALHGLLKDCAGIREELMFEVTESAKITDLEVTNKTLQSLRALGHHVCLDDFGAGAAAFQYLRALQVDFVKIDGVYVKEALTKPNAPAFLRAMASLCTELGIDTVGEFVETDDVAKFLQSVGVRYGQGWLFGKPGMGVAPTKPAAVR